MKIYYMSFWNIILKDEKLFPVLNVGMNKGTTAFVMYHHLAKTYI